MGLQNQPNPFISTDVKPGSCSVLQTSMLKALCSTECARLTFFNQSNCLMAGNQTVSFKTVLLHNLSSTCRAACAWSIPVMFPSAGCNRLLVASGLKLLQTVSLYCVTVLYEYPFGKSTLKAKKNITEELINWIVFSGELLKNKWHSHALQ